VRGTYFLVQRISELDALEYIDENYSSRAVAAGAIAGTAEGIVMAPIRGVEKVYDTVSDTKKLGKTIRSVPGGIASLFSMAADAVGDVYSAGRDVVRGSSAKESKGGGISISQGAEVAGDKALDLIGYHKAFREFARELNIDPATENELLRSELRRVSTIKTTVKIGSRFVPAVPSIPGVGSANRYLGYAQQAAMYDDPDKVEELNRKLLSSLGQGEQGQTVPEYEAFMANKYYSAAMRRQVLENVEKLKELRHVSALLIEAGQVSSREGAHFYLQAIHKLVELHKGKEPLAQIVPDVLIPAAISRNNTLIVPLPVDYLVWTEDVSDVFKRFKRSARKAGTMTRTRLLIGGGLSSRCRTELMSLGATEIVTGVAF